MILKRILLLAPLGLVLLLAQSYFWVPAYETQVSRTPSRATKLVEASIGDARILNPILNADTSSARITDLVFDGLLDLDEDLRLRGRLAHAWRVSESAYLLVDEHARLTSGKPAPARSLAQALRRALTAAGDGPVESVDIVEPESRTLIEGDARVEVSLPHRVRLQLSRVDPDLMQRLRALLGPDYGAGLERASWVVSHGAQPPAARWLEERLPLLEHNPEIEFELRRDVRFHDGHAFDAGDVRFTYAALMAPENLSPRTSDFEPIKAVEIIDPHTVRVVYKRLFSPAINAWTIGILPEHLLDMTAREREIEDRALSSEARASFGLRDSRFNRAPVGTGPFRFVEWRSDELVHLERNEAYWDGAPLFEEYFFRILPDPLTREIEFRTGAVDVYEPQPHQAARYRRDKRYQALASLRLGYTYIGYNMRRAPFTDPAVRRALGMAIDVDAIIEHVVYGQGDRVTGPYPIETDWYDPGVAPLPHDPQGALALLESRGWRRGEDGWLEKDGRRLEFNLITHNGNMVRRSVATIAQAAWRDIGIKVNTQLFEWAVFLEDFINPGQFDAVILGWSMGIDPDLFQLWHSSQAGPHQLNFVGYRSDEADALIERIRKEYDVGAQRRLARSLHRRIAADQPYTFLFAPLLTHVLDRKVVMVEADGSVGPVRAGKGANVFFHMNRWRKRARAEP
jgi:ABC-type transport system substrate-binding protein